jgi:NADPH2:quinone reductase
MQAVRYHEHGGTEVLGVEEVDRPAPGHGEVLVEVAASSVNPVDTKFREGGAFEPGDLPWIPGCDVAGTVAETGAGVTDFETDDRVFGTGLSLDRPGACAEYVAVPTELLAHLPESVDAGTAAATALVGVTAWESLIEACGLRPADTCLVHGGSGGVGHVAVQLAAATGATVTTTASTAYHDRLRRLGADEVFDYRRDDLAAAVTDAGRPDAILDHRVDEYADFDARVATQDADVAVIGNQRPAATIENVPRWRGKSLSMHHVSMFNTPDTGAVLARLGTLMAEGTLSAVVAREYSLEAVAEAHRAVVADSYLGKLVVTL